MLKQALSDANGDLDHTRKLLKMAAQSLLMDMQRLVKRLEAKGDVSINNLGEVQGQGLRIDLLCMQYYCQMTTVSKLSGLELEDRADKSY